MKLVLLLSLLVSFTVSAQTNPGAEPAPAQDQMGSPAAGEASMAQETKPMAKHKKARKAHHAKAKKHHKKKKHSM